VPKDRTKILQAAFRKAYNDPEFFSNFRKLVGDDPSPLMPIGDVWMRRLSLGLLILALAIFAFGIIRWVILGNRIAEERREQANTGRVALNLSRQEGWQTTNYILRRAGLYSLVLETRGRSSKPRSTATFTGAFEIEILDSFGKIAKRWRIDGGSLHHTNDNHIHWSGLDTVSITSIGPDAWKIRASVSRGDDNFAETTSTVILQPPAQFDAGWAGFSRGIEAALSAGLGLILLAASGVSSYFARRSVQ
jgi:hypothetical protein